MGRRGIITISCSIIRRLRIPSFHVPLKQPPATCAKIGRFQSPVCWESNGPRDEICSVHDKRKEKKRVPSPLLAPRLAVRSSNCQSSFATSDEQHVITSFYSSSGQNEPRMIRDTGWKDAGKATHCLRDVAHDDDWPSGGVCSNRETTVIRAVDGGKQLRHVIFISLLLPSAAVRHRRINFAFFLKGKVVTASIASVTCLSPPLQSVAFLLTRKKPSFLRGALLHLDVGFQSSAAVIGPGRRASHHLFWSGCIFGLLCCFVVGYSRMPIFCGSDPYLQRPISKPPRAAH